jgi:hypothetical protein
VTPSVGLFETIAYPVKAIYVKTRCSSFSIAH